MLYQTLTLIHIISSTVLFGGGVFAGVLGTIVYGSHKTRWIAEFGPPIVKVELYLTVLAALTQVVTGSWMASIADYPLSSGWLGWALMLLGVAGVCWIIGVRLQHRMVDLSSKAVETNSGLSAEYHKLFKVWTFLGLPSTTAMLGIFYLMVFKPG
ncbi:DUF2269 domain-containing protein [Bradyrhizobium sp. 83012]|uniref:DUF2269 domain-containing protein n=1 Tax=Bradyrhizobium aeschynomenes TaxID=2734909 RepID=A0ABX2CEM6_9BRAD|nr:DUF2269 domain-containing protein [Bradyrhizobium aeschynomenes]NPU66115.1 DUF2269 domain-containing protein [Bradyrhizobium aeschynomenes]NPV20733.1 DUF2269 domain-containing protein [Bradyrhizobium aeschynomenes]